LSPTSGAVLAGIRGGSAELPGAILRGADGANFNGARLVGTVLEGKLPVEPRVAR
jgi:hypothetical protein